MESPVGHQIRGRDSTSPDRKGGADGDTDGCPPPAELVLPHEGPCEGAGAEVVTPARGRATVGRKRTLLSP